MSRTYQENLVLEENEKIVHAKRIKRLSVIKEWLSEHRWFRIVTISLSVIFTGLSIWYFGYYLDVASLTARWFTRIVLQRNLFPGGPNPAHFRPAVWFWLMLILVVVGVIRIFRTREVTIRMTDEGSDDHYDRTETVNVHRWRHITPFFGAAVALLALFIAQVSLNVNDKAASYAPETQFVVSSINQMPATLQPLARTAMYTNDNGCKIFTDNNMPGCINEGEYDHKWEARTSSYAGASKVMSNMSGGGSRTELLTDTVTYLNRPGGKGIWTGIRDGKSKQPIDAVVQYDGVSTSTCNFSGQYAINKAFDGRWGHNLNDVLASQYPGLFFESSDRYGYCDGDQPVIVIPVTEQYGFRFRAAFRSAGVLVIKGSPTGKAQITHVTNVKPGDYPGPVYPASLAREQRTNTDMLAGWKASWQINFGYESTDAATQAGNDGEYLLRDAKSGRDYWVTPMKPRTSDNQLLTAYAVIPADTSVQGTLNPQKIYVLPDNDLRATTIDSLTASVKTALSRANPGFFSSGGTLTEFLPLDGATWQVFGEQNGRNVYKIIVPANPSKPATVINLGVLVTPASACKPDLTLLSNDELRLCLTQVAAELSKPGR